MFATTSVPLIVPPVLRAESAGATVRGAAAPGVPPGRAVPDAAGAEVPAGRDAAEEALATADADAGALVAAPPLLLLLLLQPASVSAAMPERAALPCNMRLRLSLLAA